MPAKPVTTDHFRIGQPVTVLPATVAGAQRPATVVAIDHQTVLVAHDNNTQQWVPAFRVVAK